MTPQPSSKTEAAPESVFTARVEAMNAVQWLARLTLSYAMPEGAGRTPHLRWNGAARTIVTPDVAPGVAVEVALPTLMMQFVERGKPSPHAIDIDGKSSTEVEAWLLVELLHRGFDREHFSKSLPYYWVHLMTGDEAKYSPQTLAPELGQLAQWFEGATDTLLQARGILAPDLASKGPDLDFRPESFDIGFSLPTFADADSGRTEVGFTIGDDREVRAGFFVRREGTGSVVAGPVATLPWSDIVKRELTREQVVEVLVEKAKGARAAASN